MRISIYFAGLITLPVLLTHGLPVQDTLANQTRSTPEKLNILPCPDGRTTGNYIVTIQEGLPRTAVLAHVNSTSKVIELDSLNSFVGSFDRDTLDTIRGHSDVSSITEECFMNALTTREVMTQGKAPWNLARLTSPHRLHTTKTSKKDPSYTYNYIHSAGSCADVYIVDTGINIHHKAFEGRAFWGATFGDYGVNAMVDADGHGTHVAGIVGSSLFGVAKGVRLIAVKVTDGTPGMGIGNILQGLEWVLQNAKATGRPSIANLSFSVDGLNTAVDRAVDKLIRAGVHVVVAAGNLNMDVAGISPATVPFSVTVGGSTIFDARSPYSNYGRLVDIFAPGDFIMSTSKGSDTATAVRSGTSMAAPHVSGWIASYRCMIPNYPRPTPAYLRRRMIDMALKGVLANIPNGTPNKLLHIPSMF